MVSDKQLIAYLLFSAAACLAQMAASSEEGGAQEGDLFSLKGYPMPGDIPVLNRKIFRGARVTIMEHPYMASVRRNHAQYLTGALVTQNTIITVAHPLYNHFFFCRGRRGAWQESKGQIFERFDLAVKRH
ncbi:hypothetical protein MSG28_000906 [Choristoneura fumiferana]|uniref:Uncharacterized protein n=1 Tax=Choristoneura fumiferana TaxID=7141 RepID=A0ACC0K2R7_CHOFU|nr:hypothetical protein MSG28_000906 [Choristoneura fumiferana]